MLLLAGASAIALLAFLGTPKGPDFQSAIAPCLATFAIAAFLAVANMGFTYLSQCFFTYATRQRRNYSLTLAGLLGPQAIVGACVA